MELFKFIEDLARTKKTVLVAYSGGKDSTYILKMLSEHNVEVIAYLIDNSFISETTYTNAMKVAKTLGIRLIVDVKPQAKIRKNFEYVLGNDVFSTSQKERASDICNVCMYYINKSIIKFALDNGIEYISGGYLEGQVPKTGYLTKIPLKMYESALHNIESKLAEKDEDTLSFEKGFLYSFNPLLELKIHEEEILRQIKTLGWIKPDNTGLNSSNCLINDFAIKKHIEKYGINPYRTEIEAQLKNGTISEAEAAKRLEYDYSNVADIEI